MSDFVALLRTATEEDVERVLAGIHGDGIFRLEAPPVDLLEFFNRMIDELTGERASAEEIDDMRLAHAAASGL